MKIDVLWEEVEAKVSFLGKGDQGEVVVTMLIIDRFVVVYCFRLAVEIVVGVSSECDRWSVVGNRLVAVERESVPWHSSSAGKVVEGV